MDIRTDLIRRHWRVVLVTTLLSGVLAFAASFLWSPRYLAIDHVLVRVREARLLTTTGEDLSKQPTVVDSSVAKSVAQTHANLLTSRALAERVVKELKLDDRPQDSSFLAQLRGGLKQAYKFVVDVVKYGYYREPTPYEGAVVNVQTSLEGKPVKDSYVIEVRATADDPQLAAALADSATKNLIDMSRERGQQEAGAHQAFLKAQADRLLLSVQQAEKAVQQYKEEQGITDVGEAIRLDAQAGQDVRLQLRQTETDLAAALAEHDVLQAELDRVSRTDSSTSTIATGRSTTTTTSTSTNPIYSGLRTQVATLNAKIAALEAKRDALSAMVDPTTAPLPANEAKLRDLELQVTIANEAYKAVRTDYEAATRSSEQDNPEITQVDTAGVPLYPESPVRYLYLIIGLLMGAMGGVGLTVLADRRVSRPVRPVPMPGFGRAPHPVYSAQREREMQAPAGPGRQ